MANAATDPRGREEASGHLGWPSTRTRELARPPWAPNPESDGPPHPLGKPEEIRLDHFVVTLGPKLDRAEGWGHPNGEKCENRAHVGKLHDSPGEARAYIPRHSLEWICQVLNLRPPSFAAQALWAEGPLPTFNVLHVEGTVLGYDYREAGCRYPDAFDQLWRRRGRGPAWQTVLSNRDNHGAQAAALPGRTSGGSLFAFVTGCEGLRMTVVEPVPGRLPDGYLDA